MNNSHFIKHHTLYGIYFFFMFGMAISFSSCYNTKPIAYFKSLPRDTTVNSYVSKDFETKIRKDDALGITVSSMNHELDLEFNGTSDISNNAASNTTQTASGYLVDDKGQILLHFLGKVKENRNARDSIE